MEQEEHEVYGADIPDEEVEMDADAEQQDEQLPPNHTNKDLEDMKKRLKEIEEEASALREMQAKVEKEMGAVQDSSGPSATQAEKEEVDARSIYVGDREDGDVASLLWSLHSVTLVDYACTPEEVQQHFQSCGTMNRVTILTDKFGQPKRFAYVEFVEIDAVQNALLLNESELHGRQLKVSAKRTYIPGMKQYYGRRSTGFRSRRPFMHSVDYACTPEEVQQHFQSCGTVNRVTILTDKFGQPKGFAYVEFVEIDAVQNALLLNESELHGRQLKVSAKRTNIPGMKQYYGRRSTGFRSRRPFMPPAFFPPYGYGRVPRYRRPTRYRPY